MVPAGLTCVPGRDLVAVEFPYEAPRWYDGVKLTRIKAPEPFGDRFPLWISPGGEYALFENHHSLELAVRLAF